ncbi:MAG: diguanylate cyclase [Candidatus Omnitrophica bacterium]|nr:diguanylate cyclase [Candidatus Omnitrophota bacterium]MDD5355315.1 diguanylate cyclase [Candidatus Omnitrophota bacterium]
MNKKCLFFSIALFITFASIFYIFPNFLFPLELRVCDSFFTSSKVFSHPSAHTKEVVVVALDDVSTRRLNKRWPLSRAFFAELLGKIYEGNPKTVFFDIIFAGDSENPRDDELFEDMVKGKDNILFPYYFGRKNVQLVSKKAFTSKVGTAGYINKLFDKDGAIRRFYPFILNKDKTSIKDYTAEMYIFGKYYNYDIKKNIALKGNKACLNQFSLGGKSALSKDCFYLRKDGSMLINYNGPTSNFQIIPMFRVILGEDFSPDLLNDKIVLIGETSNIFHDTYDTPFGRMPGTLIIANTALMFLDGRFISEIPDWLKWLIIFLVCLLIVFVCYNIPIIKGLFFTVSIAAIAVFVTFILFLQDYYLNPFKIVLMCLVAYVCVNFYKYAAVVIENMKLRKLSTVDELTGLFVFRYFKIVLNHEFEKCLRYKTPLSLLMIDIDNFKKINDTYGHQKGNVVLSKIGKIVSNSVRRSDFPARYGGEELSVLLPNSDIEGVKKCAETIRSRIENEDYFMTDTGPLKVTVSIGVASFPMMDIPTADDMVKLADAALYEAKKQGKNRVIVFSNEISKET